MDLPLQYTYERINGSSVKLYGLYDREVGSFIIDNSDNMKWSLESLLPRIADRDRLEKLSEDNNENGRDMRILFTFAPRHGDGKIYTGIFGTLQDLIDRM